MIALYRHYDESGVLLYVGIALNPIARLKQHRDRSRWFLEIRRVEIQYFGSRKAARCAELAAIAMERPKFNVQNDISLSPSCYPVAYVKRCLQHAEKRVQSNARHYAKVRAEHEAGPEEEEEEE